MAEAALKLYESNGHKEPEHLVAQREHWPFETMRRDAERVFEGFYKNMWQLPFPRPPFNVETLWHGAPGVSSPAVDVVERSNDFLITVELPGMDVNDIEVSVTEDRITLKGEKREEHSENAAGRHVSERRYGSFQRSFALPEGIDGDNIEAEFKNGVLTLRLPKKPELQKEAKKLSIKTA